MTEIALFSRRGGVLSGMTGARIGLEIADATCLITRLTQLMQNGRMCEISRNHYRR